MRCILLTECESESSSSKIFSKSIIQIRDNMLMIELFTISMDKLFIPAVLHEQFYLTRKPQMEEVLHYTPKFCCAKSTFAWNCSTTKKTVQYLFLSGPWPEHFHILLKIGNKKFLYFMLNKLNIGQWRCGAGLSIASGIVLRNKRIARVTIPEPPPHSGYRYTLQYNIPYKVNIQACNTI